MRCKQYNCVFVLVRENTVDYVSLQQILDLPGDVRYACPVHETITEALTIMIIYFELYSIVWCISYHIEHAHTQMTKQMVTSARADTCSRYNCV